MVMIPVRLLLLCLLSQGWQCTQTKRPQPLALTCFPPKMKFFGLYWCCWSALHVPPGFGLFLGRSLSVRGGLHSLAGACWSRPAGHLECCGDTAAPCWCFCSCCLTCWMISRIFLCAVCLSGPRGSRRQNKAPSSRINSFPITVYYLQLLNRQSLKSDYYAPGWQKNARRFSRQPHFFRPEFGPAVRWPQRSWGSAARSPEDKKTRQRLHITPLLLTFRERVSNYSKPKQSWIKQSQPGALWRSVIHLRTRKSIQ